VDTQVSSSRRKRFLEPVTNQCSLWWEIFTKLPVEITVALAIRVDDLGYAQDFAELHKLYPFCSAFILKKY
jgi:hypothetical protein